MGGKARRVFVRVTQTQLDNMKGKARGYGITLSALVLASVEAYVRTYGEDVGDADAVAVNYGVWVRVDSRLGGIEAVLRETAQQLVGIRWLLAAERRSGGIGEREHREAFGALKSCREDMERMREDVARCTRLLDDVCARTHLTDPYLGPMERVTPDGEDG